MGPKAGVQGTVLERDDERHRVPHGRPDDAGHYLKEARHQREQRAVPQHHELEDVRQQVAGKGRPVKHSLQASRHGTAADASQ